MEDLYGIPSNVNTLIRSVYNTPPYDYYPNTNRLRHIADNPSYTANYTEDIDNQSAAENYKYDKIGNLVFDDASDITNIEWTVYGKIAAITKRTGNNLTYTYDASGNRISKTVGNVTTVYVRDAQGNVMSVYQQTGSAGFQQTETHLYGSSRLGVLKGLTVVPTSVSMGTGSLYGTPLLRAFTRGEKQYELGNHLGNVLATITDRKNAVSSAGNSSLIEHFDADIASAQDYYPFGMQMPGRTYSNGNYRYGFNGKENSSEVNASGNSYTAEFWEYDSRIGLRWNTDPKPTVGVSPYSAFFGNPILYNDLLGDSTGGPGTGFFKKDNTNYKLDYNPVFSAPNFFEGLGNAVTNTMNFVSNVTVGPLSEGAKNINNYFAGGYKESTTNPIQSFIDFTSIDGEYRTHTSINQQLKDFGNAFTDLHTYELPAQLAIGGAFSRINIAEKFTLKSTSFVEVNETLRTNEIHFMQSSIKNTTGEFTVLGNAEALKAGTLNPGVLRMNVWKDANGKIWTLDHRRLAAFKLSGIPEAPIQWANPSGQMWKMTTPNGGTSIRLKLGNGHSRIVK
ncbi:hypothetical protein ACX0G9_30775 [Flavitalea flava]